MSWVQKLYKTYEYAQSQGLSDENLALPFHISKAVHLKVTLNEKGEMVSAERFDGKKQVPIQVTESSSKRAGSTIASYALHDNLQYIAKTAPNYLTIEYLTEVARKDSGKKWREFLLGTDEEKSAFADKAKSNYQKAFLFYEQQLSDWAAFSDLKEIQIVYDYIKKGSLIEDLIAQGVFSFENNVLASGGKDPFDFTVVWAVEMPNDLHADLWSKSSIQTDWINYQESQSQDEDGFNKDLCCITGKESDLLSAYPKILGNGKLVSANDKDGFTYLGRFLNDRQAVSLGREVSQKAFNALKWLIARQGMSTSGQVTVLWAIGDKNLGKDVPSPLEDAYNTVEDDLEWHDDEETLSKANEARLDYSTDLGRNAAKQLKKKLNGIKTELKEHEQLSLLMLDSATDGRMALTYYQEFLPADYFANLDTWIDDFSWCQRHSKEIKEGKKSVKHTVWPYLPPSPYAIFEAIYGKVSDKDGKLKKQLYARLLPVIAGGKSVPIPFDLVQKSFQTACNPSGYEHWEWERNVGVACALLKGYYARHHDELIRRNYVMALDKENHSRDYLYGRLLAVAENIESYALYLAEEKRATTAERYMQRFAEHPFLTWRNIELALVPYQDRLRSRQKDTGKQAISEIMELFDAQDFTRDDKLSGEFLLGYHCQKMATKRQIEEAVAAKAAKKDNPETSN